MANTWISKLRGTMSTLFGIGGPSGVNVKNNSGVAEIRNSTDAAFASLRAANIAASGETINDVVSLLDLRGRCPNIMYSFAGGSPPAGGINTNLFGFCHTSGGSYTAGDVVFDTGSALVKIPSSVCSALTTGSSITGTISLIANGVYALQGGTWTLKGDGGSESTGLVKSIEIAYVYSDATKTSTTTIPDGASILSVKNRVTTPFNNGATLAVSVEGTASELIMATTDNDQLVASEYVNNETIDIVSTTTGVIQLTLANSPDAGAGSVIVLYTTASV